MAFDADMIEIVALYREESLEGLDTMESCLLRLDLGTADTEIINEIFRAAHSIKGGGATFGFTEISDFAHHVETFLDEIRQNLRPVTKIGVDLVLQSVDCMRAMLSELDSNEGVDKTRAEQLELEFKALLNQAPTTDSEPQQSTEEKTPVENKATSVGWEIVFNPEPQIFKSGNDPLKLFTELSDLGELKITAKDFDKLDFHKGNPEHCALSWHIRLYTDAALEQIEELFTWVRNECELEITPIAAPATPTGMFVIAPIKETDDTEQTKTLPDPATAKPVKHKAQKSAPPGKSVDSKKAAKPVAKKQESGSIRVNTDKVDALINLVGELVITQSMLSRFGRDTDPSQIDDLKEGLAQLSHNTRDLQESVMRIRMMPISFAFSRFPRLVRDTSSTLGKEVELRLMGEDTELDKTVLEKIGDPLVHLVRNSLDHGLETPEVRTAAGKPATGILTLGAFHEGGNIVIQVSDDGAGINTQRVLKKAQERGLIQPGEELSPDRINNLIFMAGFSTADEVSDLSGRGVGMDVVRRNIADLGGQVSLKSEVGKGSTFTIRLPLTLAILDGQLIKVHQQTYIIPLISIVETVQVSLEKIGLLAGKDELFRLRDEYIPILRLYDLFSVAGSNQELAERLLVVVEANNQRFGVLVDDLLEQQQVVIKSLESNFMQTQAISGATILGDGTVALIIDIRGLVQLSMDIEEHRQHKAA